MKANPKRHLGNNPNLGEDKVEKETRGGDRTDRKRERQDRSKLTQRERETVGEVERRKRTKKRRDGKYRLGT